MPELMDCPKCQAMLRLPDHATVIRCPKCKLLLEIAEQDEAPAPLPSDSVAPAPQLAGLPKKRIIRPAVVDEEAEARAEEQRQKRAEVERNRQMRKELDAMDRTEDAADNRYEEIIEECRWGRISLKLLMVASYCYAAGIGLIYLGVFPLLLDIALSPVVLVAYVCTGVGNLTLLAAFGCSFKAMKETSFAAGMGLGATVIQIIAMAGGLGTTAVALTQLGQTNYNFGDGYTQFETLAYVEAPATTFSAIADVPSRLITAASIPVFPVIAAIFEFCRLILMTQLVQRYAELAKHERTSAEPSKVVSGLFWVILLTALFRMAIALGFDRQAPRETAWYIGMIAHGLLTTIQFGLLGFQYVKLSQTCRDVDEFLNAERVASKHDRLDAV